MFYCLFDALIWQEDTFFSYGIFVVLDFFLFLSSYLLGLILQKLIIVMWVCYILYAGATVEPFGSFVSDLFTRWGDLDISIELANGSYIASAGKKHKQNLLEDVLKALKSKGIILLSIGCLLISST